MNLSWVLVCCGLYAACYGQEKFTRADSLQGSLRFERTNFNVLRYSLNITVNPAEKSIQGFNEIKFLVVENTQKIQLDLFENMRVDSIVWNHHKLNYTCEYDAVFIDFPEVLIKNSAQKLQFYYSGKPHEAENAPWDGGFVWKKDANNKDWVGVAVQGTGASLWYPVKDHQTDEPEQGASIKVAVPNGLMNVSNGRFLGSEDLKNGYTRWDWEVKNPINNYTITVNIGDYVHFGENYKGLDLDYYVLRNNLEKAKIHFEEVKPMLDCFQTKFGKFPFWEDGYKLAETPYLGMEHQSAIAYGNQYKKGYLGRDISGTGVGLLFDYITIHESGHEWFGNSITSKDIADMWIHEGFTTYTESVFVECQFGYEKALEYLKGQRRGISNKKPIIGQFGVNFKTGNSDMYYKGALMLHTLRSVINNDELWWKILLDYSQTYKHQIIDTQTVIDFFNQTTGKNLTAIFNQYLQYKNPPILELKSTKGKVYYRWKTDEKNFNMPIEITFENQTYRWEADNQWQKSTLKTKDLNNIKLVSERFYVLLEW